MAISIDLDCAEKEDVMAARIRSIAAALTGAALALAAATPASAADEKKLVGTYKLVKRTSSDGKTEKAPPEVIGSMTFSKTRRTVIMKWTDAAGAPVSVAVIADYSMSGEKYCEAEVYGVQTNLGGEAVAFDTPAAAPSCTAALDDATGLSFDIPGEKLRIRVTRDGVVSTTPKWTDHWERVR